MAKKQPWELKKEAEEAARIKNVKALSKKLSAKQMDALLEAVNSLREFDCEY